MAYLKNIKVDLSGLEEYRKKLYEGAVKSRKENLIRYAKETLKKAFLDSDYTNRTLNLKDSYVWGVFYNGKKEAYGFLSPDSDATTRVQRTGDKAMLSGREEAQDFINSYEPTNKRGWEVVFAATIYYGVYLQNGTKRNKQYVVISSIFDNVEKDFKSSKIISKEYTYGDRQ